MHTIFYIFTSAFLQPRCSRLQYSQLWCHTFSAKPRSWPSGRYMYKDATLTYQIWSRTQVCWNLWLCISSRATDRQTDKCTDSLCTLLDGNRSSLSFHYCIFWLEKETGMSSCFNVNRILLEVLLLCYSTWLLLRVLLLVMGYNWNVVLLLSLPFWSTFLLCNELQIIESAKYVCVQHTEFPFSTCLLYTSDAADE